MDIQATEKLTTGVLDAHLLEDEAIRRLRFGADAIVTFSRGSAPSQVPRFAELLPGVPVTDGGVVDDVRGAMIECGRRGVLVLITPPPTDARRFVARAIQGAATVADEGGDVIAVQVIRRSVPVDKIAWLTETGEVSGYGVLYAAGFAKKLNAEVVLITPSGGTRTPRTPAAVELAKKAQEEHGIAYSVISDPSPIDRVIRNADEVGVVVHPVLDAPGGRSLLHWGELPKSSTASGSPEAVIRLLEGFAGNVVMVFDGTQLLAGGLGRAAGLAGVGLLVALGMGVVIPPAPAAAADGSTGARGNTAVVQVDGQWYETVEDVVRNLHFTAREHSGSGTDLEVINKSQHDVTISVTGYHGHGGNEATTVTPTIRAGQTHTVSAATGGVKHWSTATITAIDGRPLPHPIELVTGGVVVNLTPTQIEQAVEENAPKPEPITWTEEYTPPAPTRIPNLPAPIDTGGPVTIVEQPGPETVVPTDLPAPVEVPADSVTIVEQVPDSAPTLVPDLPAPVDTGRPVTIVEQPGPDTVVPTDLPAPVEIPADSVTIVEQVPDSAPTLVPDLPAPVEIPADSVTVVDQATSGAPVEVNQSTDAGKAPSTSSVPAEDTEASGASALDELAHTGGSAGLAVLGAGLVAGGAGLAAAARKREDGEAEEVPDERDPAS